jgi:SNF family Na+-dependent transporter
MQGDAGMSQKERWATRIGLVLAMAGNAVGLGNFLRFPKQAIENGGGAFLIPYIVALVLMGLPLMWVEWAMGRHGGQHGHHSTPGIFQAHHRNPMWKYFGVLGLWSCLVIAAFYLYIESWCMAYAGYSLINGFEGKNKGQIADFLGALTGEQTNEIIAISPWGMLIFFACISINIFILSRGLAKGIEFVAKIGMPLLILFGAVLAVRGLFLTPGEDKGVTTSPWEGVNFVWNPSYDSLSNPKVWLAAAGQIFFTLSIGMGSIHCFASYLRDKDDVALTGTTTAFTNEFCEVILGGMILIPIATAYIGLQGVKDNSHFGLGFFVFPELFNNWGWAAPVAGFMWFGLLFFAAITSSLAMGQPIMAFLQEEFGMTRQKSALALGMMVLALALPVALMHSNSFFDEFDYWGGTVFLVVFALGETILFAWLFGMNNAWAEITKGAELKVPGIFFYVIKYVTPVFLLIILSAYVFQPKGELVKNDKGETVERGWTTYVEAVLGKTKAPAWEWSGNGMIGRLLHVDIDDEIYSSDRKAQLKKASDELLSLPETQRTKEMRDKFVTLEKREPFLHRLKLVRNIDRIVMVGVFLFLCLLVAKAWQIRRLEGRA